MNVTGLEAKYPLTWRKFVEWQFLNGTKYVSSPFDFLVQEWRWQKSYLVDFFDANGVFIEIIFDRDMVDEKDLTDRWTFDIANNSISDWSWYNTRSEAEIKGLLQAFQVLENRLKV